MFSGIELFYVVCAGVGFLFTLFAALSGHHGHAGSHGGHAGFRAAGHGHTGHLGIKGGHGHTGNLGAKGTVKAGGHGPRGSQASHTAGEGQEAQTAAVSFLSPMTIAMFVGSLGFLGIIGREGLGFSPSGSFVFAAPLGLLFTVLLFYVFVKVFVSSQGSSVFSQQDAVGHEAEVVTKIDTGRVGSIAYVDKGKRLTLPARADDEQGYSKGERVYVIGFDGNTALVRRDRGQLWGE